MASRPPRKKNRPSWAEKSQNRLVYLGMGFLALYAGVAIKALFATVLTPMAPLAAQVASPIPEIPHPDPKALTGGNFILPNVRRASIIDRNGQPLALSLPVVHVYANPMEIIDPEDIAVKLQGVLPDLDLADTIRRLKQDKQFVYLARNIAPTDELAINNLGIPGIYFENSEQRHYPLGHLAAQILGGVDIDNQGIAGLEYYFNHRLMSDQTPLRLSIDARVQAAMRDELNIAKEHFQAIGACAILMDVHTGEIVAMVSLPDYDANNLAHAPADARFNRAVTGMYEPGSTFKLQTAAMALQLGVVHPWDQFSTAPIHIDRFTISDLSSDHFAPWLALPSVMAFSSNPASAHIALDVGVEKQQEWLKNMGLLDRAPIELPESGRPIVPPAKNWGITRAMTVAFGHGIAESPLAIVRGTATTGNGGYLVTPTLVSHNHQNDDVVMAEDAKGPRLISAENANILRRILRLVVTKGIGRRADSPGYLVGGKTGTAEKISEHGTYLKHVNITAFTGMFPMNNPRYALYVMLDAPQGTEDTHGQTTAGWIAAPIFSKIVTRTAPMLGLFPYERAKARRLDAEMAMPLTPSVPPDILHPLGPGNDPGAQAVAQLTADHDAARRAVDDLH